MEENNAYAIVGGMGLLALSGLSIPTIPLLPIGIGIVGLGSLYGCYMIATKEEREKKRVLEGKKDELERFFIGAGIKNKEGETPILTNIWKTDNGHIYSFINPIGMSTHDYDSKDIAIKEFLNCKDVLFEIKNDFLNITTIEVDLPKFVPFVLPKRNSDDLIVELGVAQLGKKVNINFSKIHSWLIAGATGSGKSVCTHTILTQLYSNYSNDTEFYICDLKKTELNNYRNLSATVEYVDDVKDVETIIDKLLKICDDRHLLFTKHNVKNLQECARLMNDKQLQNKIAELAFIARSAGIVIIMTIQRATKNLMSGDIKCSLLGKIGFKTVNRINSQVIMDDDRLFKIKERGECAISCEDISIGETNVKVMYLQEDKIDKILKQNSKYKGHF